LIIVVYFLLLFVDLGLWIKSYYLVAREQSVRFAYILDTAVELVKNGDYGTPVPDYTDENVSTKVVKIIQSYVGVVNKMVWRK